MPRAHHHVVKPAAGAKYVPMLANPLNPLAAEVGQAVAREVAEVGRRKSRSTKASFGLGIMAAPANVDALGARMTALVARVLEQSLSAHTVQGKALRMALIAKLANEEIGSSEAAPPVVAQGAATDVLLTTAEAAAKLEASRPYVSMLCNAGKLGEVVMTEGGHRRIRSSAVQAYLATRAKQHEGAMSPRQAGVEAGLYDYPDGHFVNVVRGDDASRTAKKAAPAKAARKPRP
ncbi:DNA-binding protein [Variovorax sp. WS11]|uniref:helix-turn-helix domain-containing protein n=1 Tax=Variovorax sp. WS11 TaxID=1105204 RepID=UPI000D0D7D0C|nr:helix-turn-helix domain-containing protein [Variovorax sp. WS11]NDZ16933.1 helix-turn-helix domain-containing protein [Variovorax sp. WS11]PSL81300.1 DNA-binding protein [Variovorax sp. WS11]